MMGFGQETPEAIEQAKQKASVVLQFYGDTLGDGDFFGGSQLTLADVVVGTLSPWFEEIGSAHAELSQSTNAGQPD
jgi:glutathione S-transferase